MGKLTRSDLSTFSLEIKYTGAIPYFPCRGLKPYKVKLSLSDGQTKETLTNRKTMNLYSKWFKKLFEYSKCANLSAQLIISLKWNKVTAFRSKVRTLSSQSYVQIILMKCPFSSNFQTNNLDLLYLSIGQLSKLILLPFLQ